MKKAASAITGGTEFQQSAKRVRSQVSRERASAKRASTTGWLFGNFQQSERAFRRDYGTPDCFLRSSGQYTEVCATSISFCKRKLADVCPTARTKDQRELRSVDLTTAEKTIWAGGS